MKIIENALVVILGVGFLAKGLTIGLMFLIMVEIFFRLARLESDKK